VVLEAEGIGVGARCRACGAASGRVHGRYTRRALDLPWRGHQVRFALIVRRFACANPTPRRRTFAEPVGDALPPRARRTRPAVSARRAPGAAAQRAGDGWF
jgi:transposase